LSVLTVKGKAEGQARAGGFVLSLLAAPLNVSALQALTAAPKSLTDLRRAAGSPPQTTMRKHLRALTQIGVLSRQPPNDSSSVLNYELSGPGQALLRVANVLEHWLEAAPEGPITLGSAAAKSAITALVEGWSSTLMRALVAQPLTLTELDALIAGLSYPSLERRLSAMRMIGLVEARPGRGRGTPYVVSDWLRRAVAPLVTAACWERRHVAAETAPIGRIDIETAFLLSLPQLNLPPNLSGLCRLAVDNPLDGERRLVGVMVGVEEGAVAYCRTRPEGDANAWASGPITAWLGAVSEGPPDQLEVGGDLLLVRAVLDGLRANLAAVARAADGPARPA
jgi:DNA-binding HxlR family transcriptional regulator